MNLYTSNAYVCDVYLNIVNYTVHRQSHAHIMNINPVEYIT